MLGALHVMLTSYFAAAVLVAKVTDDFLLGGPTQEMKEFLEKLKTRFDVEKVVVDTKLHFNGCEIEQNESGSIKLSMHRYLDRLKPIEISRTRKKQSNDAPTERENTQYRSLACTLMYLGNGVLPQASYVTSALQQQLPGLHVRNLVEANSMMKEVLSLNPWIYFEAPANKDKITVSTFSDALFNTSTSKDYGQIGLVTGLRIIVDGETDIFHPIDWCSNKQRRVSYSAYGAEILASAEGDDRCYCFKTAFKTIYPDAKVSNELFSDSRCLCDTITILHEAKDYKLRPTVQRMRNSFESGELDRMRWIPGSINPADGLTKRNPKTYYLLNNMLSSGRLNIDI